jgi:subfamily B ATP-binding cassette protein HlyB/CyaB
VPSLLRTARSLGVRVPAGDGAGAPPVGRARAAEPVLTGEQFVWLVGSVCALHGVPFDAALLRQRHAPPYDATALREAFDALGIDTEAQPHVGDAQPPAVGFLLIEAAAGTAAEASPMPVPVLVAGVEPERVIFFRALDRIASVLPRQQFAALLHGPLLQAQPRVPPPADQDAVQARPAFGFRWFVPALLQHRRIWRDVLLASAAIQLLALGLPLMTQTIIDKVIVHRTESTLIALGTGLALFMLFSAVLSWVRQTLILHTGTRIDAVLGAAVFRHLVALPPRYFQHRPTGVIAARLQGVEQIREFIASAAIALLLDLPFLSICLAIMFVYSVPLTCVALGILALIVLVSLAVSPVFQARLNREFLLGARNQAFVTEYVAGMDTVKALQMEPVLQRRYGDFLAAHLQAGLATRQVGNTYQVVATTLEQAMMLSILVLGAWIVMTPAADPSEVFTIGMLVAFQMFATRLSQPVMRMVGLWQQFQQARVAVRRLADLMDAPAEPYSSVPARAASPAAAVAAKPHAAPAAPGATPPIIRIEALAFRYGDDRPWLYEDLDLQIGVGECVGIVGPSGCGKSTLARLLLGFCLPTRGRILIGGVDSRHLSANELRAVFGVVPQETVLFSGSVLENLLLAQPHAGFDEVVDACRMAGIHQVIEQLPDGYRTALGERGVGLSGGQRQRIAIARALLKRPRVLVFDEATSHLDAATADSLGHTIGALRGRVTLLCITHARIGGLAFDRVIDLGARAAADHGAGTVRPLRPRDGAE